VILLAKPYSNHRGWLTTTATLLILLISLLALLSAHELALSAYWSTQTAEPPKVN
jgi:hypothetical protein